jgi:hypothetical protein
VLRALPPTLTLRHITLIRPSSAGSVTRLSKDFLVKLRAPFVRITTQICCSRRKYVVCFLSTEEENLLKTRTFALLAAGFIALSTSHLSAQSGTTYRDGPRLTCASDDGNRHYCAADTRYGVRLVNQRSGSPCKQGYSWGYDRRGIWVDRGCRADFIVRVVAGGPGYGPGQGYGPGGPPPGGGVITCESSNGGRNYCRVPTGSGVRLVRQRSDAPCRQGSTWGYDRGGIWVDRGCRADFAVNR